MYRNDIIHSKQGLVFKWVITCSAYSVMLRNHLCLWALVSVFSSELLYCKGNELIYYAYRPRGLLKHAEIVDQEPTLV